MHWERIKESDIKTANTLIKNPLLMKMINFLEKKGKFGLKESKN